VIYTPFQTHEGTLNVACEQDRRCVLVVDDDASYREALAAGLKGEGYVVHLATNVQTALSSFARTKPDIVLVDLRLPDGSGAEICRKMRRSFDTPIIMLSAVAEEIDIVLCFGLGADDYVTKPFRLRELAARMSAAIRQRERARKAESHPRELPAAVEFGPNRTESTSLPGASRLTAPMLFSRERSLIFLHTLPWCREGSVLAKSSWMRYGPKRTPTIALSTPTSIGSERKSKLIQRGRVGLSLYAESDFS
jgi:CheY-like chemotaxis protein